MICTLYIGGKYFRGIINKMREKKVVSLVHSSQAQIIGNVSITLFTLYNDQNS